MLREFQSLTQGHFAEKRGPSPSSWELNEASCLAKGALKAPQAKGLFWAPPINCPTSDTLSAWPPRLLRLCLSLCAHCDASWGRDTKGSLPTGLLAPSCPSPTPWLQSDHTDFTQGPSDHIPSLLDCSLLPSGPRSGIVLSRAFHTLHGQAPPPFVAFSPHGLECCAQPC